MKQLYDDLWQTEVEHPFGNLNTHAYFLQRNEGNVLFYNTGNLAEIEEIANLGGIEFQYLSHRHETGESLAVIKQKFESLLCCDVLEEPEIGPTCPVDLTFSARQVHSGNIEIIPTPGHTAGGLCFFYVSPKGLKYLFTGDTFYQSNGSWDTLVMSNNGGDRQNLLNSLKVLRELDPDMVLCSASVGDIAVVEVTRNEWHEAIDKSINGLEV